MLSSDCESIIKSVAKLSKRGADLARGGWLRRPTARGLGFEFRKLKGPLIGAAGCKKQPELSRGTPRLNTSFILFNNLASPEESGETCAAAPLCAPPPSCSSGAKRLFGGRRYISLPQLFARFRAIGALFPAGRLETPDYVTCRANLRQLGSLHTAGLRIRVQERPDPLQAQY